MLDADSDWDAQEERRGELGENNVNAMEHGRILVAGMNRS